MSIWTRLCACGGTVTADKLDPFPGVQGHIMREPHRSWSRRTALPLPPLGDPTAERLRVDVSAVLTVRPVPRRRVRGRAAVR